MRTDIKSRHQTKAAGSVFRDLGFSSTEAKRLLAHADAQIDESIRLKQQFMDKLMDEIADECLDRMIFVGQGSLLLPRGGMMQSFEKLDIRTRHTSLLSAGTDRFAGSFGTALRDPAGQLRCLPNPTRHEFLAELVVLVDVEVAHFVVLGLAGGDRTQRRAAEESHLDVVREGMEVEEPAPALDSVEGRVPLDRLAHAGDGAHDERVEAAARRRVSSPAWPQCRPARGRRRRPSRSEGCRLRGGSASRPSWACGLMTWRPPCAVWPPSQIPAWRRPSLRPSPTSWTPRQDLRPGSNSSMGFPSRSSN